MQGHLRPSRALVAAVVAATGLATAVLAVGAAPAEALGLCRSDAGIVTCTYGYTAAPDSFVVPAGVTSISVTAVGGHGGSHRYPADQSNPADLITSPGGRGASVTGDVAVSPGQTVWLTVGGNATDDTDRCGYLARPNQCGGGYNGGGNGAYTGGGGGGASDVRVDANTLAARVLVAGGGGGGGAQHCGRGGAGGDADQPGESSPAACGTPSGPGGALGTADNGATLGVGRPAATNDGFGNSGGAGGGGVYGGIAGEGDPGLRPGGNAAITSGNGGGAGGTNLVPAGGTAGPDTSGTPQITVRWTGPLPSPAAPATDPCVTSLPTVTCTYAEPGVTRELDVPDGVMSVHVVATGAPGSDGGRPLDGTETFHSYGGRGARVTADLPVPADRTLYVTAGGAPTSENCFALAFACVGGANGGGGAGQFGSGGGGASDVRTGGTAWADRVLVAGGGGGAGSGECAPGGDGGDAGQPGGGPRDGAGPDCDYDISTAGGGPGQATIGGSGGFGFAGTSHAGTLGLGGGYNGGFGPGGGGGGLYGGGAGSAYIYLSSGGQGAGGGGGGSSLVPAGGSFSLDDTRTPQVVVTYTLSAPTAPGALTVQPGDRSASVSWSAPSSDGGSPVTGYTVTATPAAGSGAATPAAISVPAGTTSTQVPGLVGGVSYTVGVTAANAVGSSPPAAADVVPLAPPGLSGSATSTSAGGAYSFAYAVTGTPAPTVSLASGTLPAGLTLSSDGVLSGTPTTAGTASFTLTARNSLGSVTSELQTVVVTAGTPSSLIATSGDGQAAVSRKVFRVPLAVMVSDDYGNPVAGAQVSFTVSSGSARFGTATSTSATTSASGVATASPLTAGTTTGPVTITATTGTAPGLTFTEAVISASAARADLRTVVSGVPTALVEGSTFTATITVANAGPNATARGITVLTLGPQLNVVSVSANGRIGPRSGSASWTNAGLASGATTTYSLTVSVGSPQRRVSTGAWVASLSNVTDPNYANNVAQARGRIG